MLLTTLTGASAGVKRILLIRAIFSDATEEPVSHNAAQHMADNEIEPFYRDMSFGSEDIEIAVTPSAYALQNTMAYYTAHDGQILDDAKVAATADHDLSAFTDFGVVFPLLPVPWNGKGNAGQFWINGGANQGIQPPPDLGDVVRIDCSEYFSFALKANGKVEHWGYSPGNTIENETDVVEIAAGDYHCLALKSNGRVSAHGSNEYGQSIVPAGLTDVVAISAGQYHSLALRKDGTMVAWGRNGFGQGSVPEGITGIVAIASQSSGNVALNSDGEVFQWGYVVQGSPPSGIPMPAPLGKVRRIAAGSYWAGASF